MFFTEWVTCKDTNKFNVSDTVQILVKCTITYRFHQLDTNNEKLSHEVEQNIVIYEWGGQVNYLIIIDLRDTDN